MTNKMVYGETGIHYLTGETLVGVKTHSSTFCCRHLHTLLFSNHTRVAVHPEYGPRIIMTIGGTDEYTNSMVIAYCPHCGEKLNFVGADSQ